MRVLRFTLMVIGLLASQGSLAETISEKIQIENPYARASVPGMHMSGAFMTFSNSDDTEHFVVRANSDAARHVELHTHIYENGMMRMRRVVHFHLKPGQKKVLKPGGLHIMLMGLNQPLVEGSSIEILLTFNDDSTKTVTVPVKSISASH